MFKTAESAPSTAAGYLLAKAVHLDRDVENWVNRRCGVYGENRSQLVNSIIRAMMEEEEKGRNTA